MKYRKGCHALFLQFENVLLFGQQKVIFAIKYLFFEVEHIRYCMSKIDTENQIIVTVDKIILSARDLSNNRDGIRDMNDSLP